MTTNKKPVVVQRVGQIFVCRKWNRFGQVITEQGSKNEVARFNSLWIIIW